MFFIEIDPLCVRMKTGMESNSKFNISIEIGIANKQTNKYTEKKAQSCHKLCSVVCHFFLLLCAEQLLLLLKPITILQNGNVTAITLYHVNIVKIQTSAMVERENGKRVHCVSVAGAFKIKFLCRPFLCSFLPVGWCRFVSVFLSLFSSSV